MSGRTWLAWRIGLAVWLAVWVGLAAAGFSGCENSQETGLLYAKAKVLWGAGQHVDAARTFLTVTELYPDSPLVQESLYWSASLYHHFLDQPDLAERYYQQLLVQYPEGKRAHEALESLADLYAAKDESLYKAILSYRKLLDEPALMARHPLFRLRIAEAYLGMGRLSQSRFELRQFIEMHPDSPLLPQVYYMTGFSYYWEDRQPLAVIAFNQIAKDFPENEISTRAQFFVGEIYEEAGLMKRALSVYESLRGTYHNGVILDRRIAALQARMGRSVR